MTVPISTKLIMMGIIKRSVRNSVPERVVLALDFSRSISTRAWINSSVMLRSVVNLSHDYTRSSFRATTSSRASAVAAAA